VGGEFQEGKGVCIGFCIALESLIRLHACVNIFQAPAYLLNGPQEDQLEQQSLAASFWREALMG
jgi:hypothetical protein